MNMVYSSTGQRQRIHGWQVEEENAKDGDYINAYSAHETANATTRICPISHANTRQNTPRVRTEHVPYLRGGHGLLQQKGAYNAYSAYMTNIEIAG